MSLPKGIIYDCDGTLIDSQHQIVSALQSAFKPVGLEAPDRDKLLSIIGLSVYEAMQALAPGLDNRTYDKLVSGYREAYKNRAFDKTEPLYEGIREHLDILATHSNARLAIATGKSRRGLDRVLKAHGLTTRFDSLQTSDNHPSKPSPAMLEAALDELACQPAHSIMIGDTTYDMMMGKAAGTATIAVTWGYHSSEELARTNPTALVTSRTELTKALEDFLS